MKIIGFTGTMGCGKSTAIEFLRVQRLPGEVHLVKFAGPLYAIQEYIYDTVSPVYARPSSFVKDRKLLQWIGTEWGRQTVGQNVWVDLWKASAQACAERESLNRASYVVVCDDVRFDNEAEIIKSLGGSVIKIDSSATDQRIDTKAGIANHSSEAGIADKYLDATVVNNGTLEQYREALNKIYLELGVINEGKRSNYVI